MGLAVHEKQEANRAATASHGELPRLPSREGISGAAIRNDGEHHGRCQGRENDGNRKETIWNSDKKNGVMRRLKLRSTDRRRSPMTTMNKSFFPG
ncbi:hypothetical protein AVEN_223514-1 [Araneus ventricosus]|uniref:Uncharacterized protein n=1 Tax=Araneus ventricosus TaxID=182803 RepID=A0A4Y2DLS6_ARAVE|nr:hypothetical protein AVEN_223514-1 [Araneus ventricosus]